MEDLDQIKDLIENNPVAFSTVMTDNKPNVIGVTSVKVVSKDHIVVTDNYMSQTVNDLMQNPNVCLVVWDSELAGYKLVGTAEYCTTGEWKSYVEQMKENEGLPAKGAILIKITKIVPSK